MAADRERRRETGPLGEQIDEGGSDGPHAGHANAPFAPFHLEVSHGAGAWSGARLSI